MDRDSDPGLRLASSRKAMRAGAYLLPNLITAGSLFCGFFSIRLMAEGRFLSDPKLFLYAAYLIVIAAVCDGLDGSVARLTRTQSAFGVQLDSLCDLISFGLAPALLAYHVCLSTLGRIGFAASFLFLVCAALRLARFNVQSNLGKASGHFVGIPVPMAALPIAAFVLARDELASWTVEKGYSADAARAAQWLVSEGVARNALVGLLFALAFGMISTFPYISSKSIKLPRKAPFKVLAATLALLVLLFSLEFTLTMAALLIAYCLHGPVMWALFAQYRKPRLEEEVLFAPVAPSIDDEEEWLP